MSATVYGAKHQSAKGHFELLQDGNQWTCKCDLIAIMQFCIFVCVCKKSCSLS